MWFFDIFKRPSSWWIALCKVLTKEEANLILITRDGQRFGRYLNIIEAIKPTVNTADGTVEGRVTHEKVLKDLFHFSLGVEEEVF